MRYRLTFIAGLAVGFVLGARAGRERYEQIRKFARKAWESPAVQQAAGAIQAQAAGIATTTKDNLAQRVPGVASAARSKAGEAIHRVPGVRSRGGARHAESDGRGSYASPQERPGQS